MIKLQEGFDTTEGPRAHGLAQVVNEKLAGRFLEEAIARPKKAREGVKALVGRRLDRVEAYGKNILFFFGEFALRVHTLIYGVVRVYPRGGPYEKPERNVWLKLVFEDYEVVGFNTPIVEVRDASNILTELLAKLGPDPLRPDWSRSEALSRLKKRCNEKIGVVLLDQSIIAGIGNILRNEVLFRARINPERTVCSLSCEELDRILEAVEQLSRTFYKAIIAGENLRKYYAVYNKYKGNCPTCGERLVYYRQQPCDRKTFICPRCQV